MGTFSRKHTPRTLRRWRIAVGIVISFGVLAALGALRALSVDGVRWRVSVLARVAAGKISDLSLRETARMLRPGQLYYLRPLETETSPFAVISNPYTASADAAAGAVSFRARCNVCHGAGGAKAPDLATNEFTHGGSDWALFRNITRGIPGTAMPPHALSEQQAWQLVAYVRSLAQGLSEQEQDGEVAFGSHLLDRFRSVDGSRLTDPQTAAGDWLTYSGAYGGWRYSPLADITPANVSRLRTRWVFQVPAGSSTSTAFKTSPVIADGIMFITTGDNRVFALDAGTGAVLWTYTRALPGNLRLCCGQVNRGVALRGTRVFFATLDAHLVALEARTGKVAWDVEMAPHEQSYSGTGAPLVVGDHVISGIAGGEFGAPGFIDAYSAESGQRVWRFDTVPKPGQKGHETWGGESWKSGGAPTWLTGTFDPTLNLIYWGVGNPSPDFFGDGRPGDNLYSNSVVALDAATGRLRWHFQFTPHDQHDWDSVHVPILVDHTFQGTKRPLLVEANRNGFYYVLDRRTGEFLLARSFVRQNWATGIDSTGRPILSANASPSATGTLTFPSVAGGTNWQTSAYSPDTGYVYVPTVDQAGVFVKQPIAYRLGDLFLGSAFQTLAPGGWSSLQAIQVATGEVVWEHRFDRENRTSVPRPCGVMATGGGVVFGCRDMTMLAFDGLTGRDLWSLNLGAMIGAAPVAFEANGEELITLAAGGILMTFGL